MAHFSFETSPERTPRSDDAPGKSATAPRSRRVFSSTTPGENQPRWYFKTREGALIGGYASESDAERGVKNFIDFVTSAPPELLNRYQDYLTAQAS